MCDYSNDCSDKSDEKQAICKNFKERNDFETDLGNWYQDQSDDFDWKRAQGYTSSSDTGPGFDHTTGEFVNKSYMSNSNLYNCIYRLKHGKNIAFFKLKLG